MISEKSVEVESQQNDAEYELKKLGNQLSFLTNNLQDKQREITQLKVSSANIPDVHVHQQQQHWETFSPRSPSRMTS